jgi:STE24 endopeptidase
MKVILILFFFLLAMPAVNAQPSPQTTQQVSKDTIRFDAAKATTDLINTIPIANRLKADSYTEGGYWLILWNFVCAAIIAWLFLFRGLSAYIQKITARVKEGNWRNLWFIVLYFGLSFLLALPLDFYQNFVREQQYGFSNQNFIQWLLSDLLIFFVELIIAAPFFVLAYVIFKKVKQNWWLWGAWASVLIVAILFIVYPVFIAPIFNDFTPLKNGRLKSEILSMARANEVDINEVYVYNESRQTKQFNASVTGVGGTGQISLNDNMLNHLTNPEIKAVMGHEMGHYVLHHLWIEVVVFGILILIGFSLVKWALNKLIIKYGERWNMRSVQDITSLPVLFFLFTLYFFILTPINNTLVRTFETEADNYGFNAARQPDAFASAMVKTADNHKIAPGYWEEVFFYDHPCRQQRILFAMKWKAENLGEK